MNKTIKTLSVFVILVLGIFSQIDSVSADGFASGNGTSVLPYVIKTAAQLNYFSEQIKTGYTFSDEYIMLKANIDMTGYEWEMPSTASFAGTFLGENRTITINSNFLGNIAEGGMINWLNLEADQTLSCPLLCYNNSGTIQNCSVKGDVYEYVSDEGENIGNGNASLLCDNNYGNIYNSYGFGTLSGHQDENSCRVGWVLYNSGNIKNCYTILQLSGSAPGKYYDVYKDGISTSGDYENCFTGDDVIANSQAFVDKLNQLQTVSGYTWSMDNANMNDGYPVIIKCLNATTKVLCSEDPMFVFHSESITTSITCDISDCTIYYTLDGTNPTTSLTRRMYSSELTFSDDFEIRTVAFKDGIYSVPTVQYGIKLYGAGTELEPYQIRSNLQLYAICFETDKNYVLKADLDFTNDNYITNGAPKGEWMPIQDFSGTFDGEAHSISGIEGTYGGLFTSNSGTIKNIRLLNHRLCNRNGETFGSIANTNSGTITCCYVSVDNENPPTSYCTFAKIGGITGSNHGTISYCRTSGKLDTGSTVGYSHMYMGGIAGSNERTIVSCVSDMDISTCYSSHDQGCHLGGITGYGNVTDCRFDGSLYIPYMNGHFGIATSDVYSRAICCYDGGAEIQITGYTRIQSVEKGYKKTNTYRDFFESTCPEFDFDTVWMITNDGPMPQGVMNRDGKCLYKTSYTPPSCNTDGVLECIDQDGNAVTETIPAYSHYLVDGVCTNDGCTYNENMGEGSCTKTVISQDGKTFTITPTNIENGNTVILALYNGNSFEGMYGAVYDGEIITFTTNQEYTNAKVMVWEHLASLKPVCGVEVVK